MYTIGEWVNKLHCGRTMKYYAAIKNVVALYQRYGKVLQGTLKLKKKKKLIKTAFVAWPYLEKIYMHVAKG